MQNLNKKVVVGLVGGSDLSKISEQMLINGIDGNLVLVINIAVIIDINTFFYLISKCSILVIKRYDYVFSENGLVAHKNGELLSREVICIICLKF